MRMLNGFLTFYYGALNCNCYYGDSAPGSELPALPSSMQTSLPEVTEGLGPGVVPGPSFVPVDWVEVVAHLMDARRSGREKGMV